MLSIKKYYTIVYQKIVLPFSQVFGGHTPSDIQLCINNRIKVLIAGVNKWTI